MGFENGELCSNLFLYLQVICFTTGYSGSWNHVNFKIKRKYFLHVYCERNHVYMYVYMFVYVSIINLSISTNFVIGTINDTVNLTMYLAIPTYLYVCVCMYLHCPCVRTK